MGVVCTAAFGVYSDQKQGDSDDSIKDVVTRELAALQEWKHNSSRDIDRLREEVGKLREAAAGAKATLELLARGRRDRVRVLETARMAHVETLDTMEVRDEENLDRQAVEQYKTELFQTKH